ncbi:type II toxin-antitoxin system PemK/MazF family toxin [Candidatus Micrarchaeota archaeon]|nr:type II toxin-antitoxin system PemK/MazF family toxin [Candidatus Micrarchaeota archaeon]
MLQREVVWVKVQYSNLAEEKERPALIISNDSYNSKNLDLIVCAITSNLEEREHSVVISNSDFEKGGLPIKSKIRADKIVQVEKKMVSGKIGELNTKTFDLVVKEIIKLIKKV